jgi:hypothetical protein
MNQRWRNIEIICIVLWINQRYISSKKRFSKEVNLKCFIILNLFYLRFCFGPHVFTGNSISRICGVVPLHGSVRNAILLTYLLLTHLFTYLLTLFSTSLTTFLFTPLAVNVWHFSCVTVRTRDRLTFVECCSSLLTCVFISSISFVRENWEYLDDISLHPQGNSN